MDEPKYMSKQYDWFHFYGCLRHVIENITGFDGQHVIMDYTTDKLPHYPFVTLSQPSKSATQASSIGTKETEVADFIIKINVYSSDGSNCFQIADDINTLLFDYDTKMKFHQYGATINDIANDTGSTNDFAGLFNVSVTSLSLKVTIRKHYQRKVNQINSIDK